MELYSDDYFMNEALKEARKAFEADEVPVGAVIVADNKIIARAHNYTERLNDVTAHAEMKDDYLQVMGRGVDDFLRKPVDLDDLRVRLKVADRMAGYTSRIQSLEGLVTICAYTKKIKLADHTWLRIEDFIENTLGIQLTHGVDPHYYEKNILPELERLKQQAERN